MIQKLIPSRSRSSPDDATKQHYLSSGVISTEAYLKTVGIEPDGVQIQHQNQEILSTEEFLQQEGVKEEAIRETRADNAHRRTSRMLILLSVVSMSTLIPLWLMTLLTLTGLGKAKFSEQMQLAILGTGIADIVGLCYVVTSDLFPKGRRSQREQLGQDDDDEP